MDAARGVESGDAPKGVVMNDVERCSCGRLISPDADVVPEGYCDGHCRAIDWLTAVRRYGIERANEMFEGVP